MGRPSSFTQEIADAICDRIAEGEPLRQICREEAMPAWRTVYHWLEADQAFAARFARARVVGYDAIAEDALEIANTPVVGQIETDKVDKDGAPYTEVKRADMLDHRKLQVETRLKLLAKWFPKKYGDKLEHSGSVEGFSLIVRERA